MAGYHLSNIEKGVVGELSKVYEEIEEVKDADAQGAELMVLIELSDVIGAIDLYLKRHHLSIGLKDLIAMSSITQRAFLSGGRS